MLATGVAAGDPGTDKARVDGELGRLRGQAEEADQQAGVFTEELSAVAGRVREFQAGVEAQAGSALRSSRAGCRRRATGSRPRPDDREADGAASSGCAASTASR